MPASLRELRQRRASVTTIKKVTRAMELIASSRIVKAQQRAQQALPYARELTRAVSAVATDAPEINHPLTTQVADPKGAAILVITSDRGLAGAYSSSVLKQASQLRELLERSGLRVQRFLAGRKAIAFATFRGFEIHRRWEGSSDAPTYEMARDIADALIESFLKSSDEGGVDEIHIVYTRFVSMLTQTPTVIRLLPLEVVEGEEKTDRSELHPLYDFEPEAESVLDELLPLYVASRVYSCLLQSAASELASRQRAMKAATDNAQQLIERLTREANAARQAEITQEISEIVGGAAALAEASAGSD
jgi:F-type H+-transporting ATPase subunit gamma